MPLRSMTGFGAAAGEGEGLAVRAEVRSVNHRYLQVKTRLPGELTFLEPKVEERIKQRVHRGAVSVHVAVVRADASTAATIHVPLALEYQRRLKELTDELGTGEPAGLAHLLSLPGVVVPDVGEALGKAHGEVVLGVVTEAAEALVAMRETEGAALGADLVHHLGEITSVVEAIGREMPGVVDRSRSGLVRRVNELLEGRQAVAEGDLAREIAILADRLDVSEEIARLDSHVEQARAVIDGADAVGRRLDFLIQEMFREVNTIGSKCSDATVAHLVVDVKTSIERLREQVQNLE